MMRPGHKVTGILECLKFLIPVVGTMSIYAFIGGGLGSILSNFSKHHIFWITHVYCSVFLLIDLGWPKIKLISQSFIWRNNGFKVLFSLKLVLDISNLTMQEYWIHIFTCLFTENWDIWSNCATEHTWRLLTFPSYLVLLSPIEGTKRGRSPPPPPAKKTSPPPR